MIFSLTRLLFDEWNETQTNFFYIPVVTIAEDLSDIGLVEAKMAMTFSGRGLIVSCEWVWKRRRQNIFDIVRIYLLFAK